MASVRPYIDMADVLVSPFAHQKSVGVRVEGLNEFRVTRVQPQVSMVVVEKRTCRVEACGDRRSELR